uniref:Uncharacterized protein n=1 Tax=Lepeophtheirus salmonis TaxID=72036 RepID=A0A0K2UF65_LEPSM
MSKVIHSITFCTFFTLRYKFTF